MREFVLTFALLITAAHIGAADDRVFFNRDVRPFLSDTCFKCHGPDAAQRQANLRLDREDSATADRGGYAVIAPGDPNASAMMQRIQSNDPDRQMPPPSSGLSLTDEQKQILRRWIGAGALYQQHWAFEPITRPEPPVDTTAVAIIDRFVSARLANAGVKQSPPASPETQLRRATLDLTGLPPTIDQLESFLDEVNRNGIDAAFEAAIDRLLSSPRFGERMAWTWLEAARYADTDGYQNDGPREMWRWRDWVIDAFNNNMPFDQFTIEQLAGDLLPNPTEQQLIATAFNRNNRYNSEEGLILDEFLLENAVDRVDTTSTVWMGLTMGCARCHDHKYDPFSQKEYYQLVDYFNDVAESGRAVKYGNSEPWIKTPTDTQRTSLAALDKRVVEAKRQLDAADPAIDSAQQIWEQQSESHEPVLRWGLDHYFSFDTAVDNVTLHQDGCALQPGLFGNAASVNGSGHVEVGSIIGLIGNGRFSVSFWMNPNDVHRGPVLSNEESNTGRAGILVEFVEGRLRWNINTRWISGVSTIETQRIFQPAEWVHVALTNDGTQRAAGMTIYVNGKEQPVNVIRNTNSNKADSKQKTPMRIGFSKHLGYWKGQIDELRFYPQRTLSADEVQLLSVSTSIRSIVALPPEERSDVQRRLLRLAFLEQGAANEQAALLSNLQKAEEERTKDWDSLPTTMIMRDLPGGRPSFVRIRGAYDQLGERVNPGVPEIFPPLPREAKNDRLAFARWLFDARHPLTARVAVNRYWQLLFGKGLVKTPEDFGSQGEAPSHAELLDWLAADFRQRGWNTKRLLKSIVTSQTYRQSSAITGQHLSKDPDNVLLARAPRRRLAANVLRDQALFVSGLLVEKRGGPSVFPYQPFGLWTEASNFTYQQGKGEDLYRRSLYSYWKRTLAPPTMALLDAADRENCSVKPKRTNTPLQALTLLNDVTFVEAARKFGERILAQPAATDAERVTFAFRTVTARRPTDQELAVLVRAFQQYRDSFHQDVQAASSLLKVGESPASIDRNPAEIAAATALANVLLNLDEVTTCE